MIIYKKNAYKIEKNYLSQYYIVQKIDDKTAQFKEISLHKN